jgi:hypothetical protein
MPRLGQISASLSLDAVAEPSAATGAQPITWTDFARHVAERFAIAAGGAAWMTLVWTFDDGGREVHQRQRIDRVEVDGREHAAILCDVVSSTQLGLDEALEHNMELAVGALALLGDTLVLRACVALDRADLEHLDVDLERLAHEAARLRHRAVRTPDIDSVLGAVGHWL